MRGFVLLLLTLALIIPITVFIILICTPDYRPVPTVEPLLVLDTIGGLRIGDIQVTDTNGSWEVLSIQYPKGVLRGARYIGGDYDPNVTIIGNTIFFNMGIMVSHLNKTGHGKRELKIIERTYIGREVIREEEKSIASKDLFRDFDISGLKTFRYSTDIPEPEEGCIITKSIELKIPVLVKRPNGELTYNHDWTHVAHILLS